MNPENLIYYKKGFLFDRSHILENKVAVEVYKLLMYYTMVNRNVRVGAYLSNSHFTKFVSLHQMIPNIDRFSEFAYEIPELSNCFIPEYIKNITGPTINEQIESVWRLEHPIWLEIETITRFKNIFGYKFKNSLTIMFKPEDIVALEGSSLRTFKITLKTYSIDVWRRTRITIE